jgi:hypothetical protein
MAAGNLARSDRAFYTTMSIIATLVVFAGFAPSFFLMAGNPAARHLAPIYHIHGAMFSLWMLFFVNQNLLIVRRKPATHMRLGQFGAVLGCLMIIMAFTVTIYSGRHGLGGPLSALPDPKQALAVPFFDMFVFAPLFFAALYYRRSSPEAHKRLMLMATVGGLLGAAIGRAPLFIGQLDRQLYLYLALILAGPVYDLVTRRRIHPAYLFALVPCLVLLTSVRLAIGATQPWHEFIGWILA